MIKKILPALALATLSINANAQIDSLKINMDFRTRAELDNGYKTLIVKDKNPETNVLSRARMGVDYYFGNLEMYLSLQDARVWGETASTAPRNGSFNVNEAWAKYQFNKNTAVKIGRQILSYDDERLLGALDWQMQGRSFDAAKGIFVLSPNSKLETVVTYNNDDNDANDLPENEFYGILDSAERTKSLQIIHYQYKNANKSLSFIGMNNVLQHVNGTHYDMLTLGLNAKHYFDKIGFFASVYWQTGKNTTAQSKSAYQFSLNADFLLSKNANIVLGTEWLSGTDFDTEKTKNNSFSPLYGTNHKFNGFMDYFFVGNHFNSVGLNDYYLKSNIKITPKASFIGNLHAFTSNAKLGYDLANNKDYSKYLGTEADLIFNYKPAKIFTVQLGHSQMFASESLEALKAVKTPKDAQSWTWLGLNFNPSFKLK